MSLQLALTVLSSTSVVNPGSFKINLVSVEKESVKNVVQHADRVPPQKEETHGNQACCGVYVISLRNHVGILWHPSLDESILASTWLSLSASHCGSKYFLRSRQAPLGLPFSTICVTVAMCVSC